MSVKYGIPALLDDGTLVHTSNDGEAERGAKHVKKLSSGKEATRLRLEENRIGMLKTLLVGEGEKMRDSWA